MIVANHAENLVSGFEKKYPAHTCQLSLRMAMFLYDRDDHD